MPGSGRIPLLIQSEPNIEFIDENDLVKISAPDQEYIRFMPRSVHYAYCKKAVRAHEAYLAEKQRSSVLPMHTCHRPDRDCEACAEDSERRH